MISRESINFNYVLYDCFIGAKLSELRPISPFTQANKESRVGFERVESSLGK